MEQERKKDNKIIDIDSFAFPKEIIKNGDKVVGYSFDADDAEKPHFIDTIIDNENYPIENLPEELQKLIISARKKKNNQEDSIRYHR